MASSPAVDEAPLAPSPRRPAGPLTFRGPDEDSDPTWAETMLAAPVPGEGTSPLDQPASSPSDRSESSDELPEDLDDGPTSSPTSSADPASVRPLTQKAQRAAARQAVKIAGSMAHQYLARDEAAQAAGLFLVDDESAEQIGDPLARIMARHAPVDGAMANPDVADGIAAMLGVANFVRKQIEATSHAAALRTQAPPAEAANV